MLNLFKKKIKKPKIKEPQVIRIDDNHTSLSGTEYHPSEYKCENCGATFTLWFGQQKCTWCYTNHTKHMETTRYVCG